MRGDKIETFKILTGLYDENTTEGMFTMNRNTIRGHSMKVQKQRCKLDVRKYFFTNRVADTWNNLPDHGVSTTKVKTFENRLDTYWKNHPMKYDYTAEYVPIRKSDTAITQPETTEMNTEEQQLLRS